MLFMEDHIQAVLPALKARAPHCDAIVGCLAAGEIIKLTPTEYKLLAVLVRHAGRVVTHRQLLKEVWGPTYVEHTEYLRVFMGQLRHKLESEPARPRCLLNEPGVGYRMKV